MYSMVEIEFDDADIESHIELNHIPHIFVDHTLHLDFKVFASLSI